MWITDAEKYPIDPVVHMHDNNKNYKLTRTLIWKQAESPIESNQLGYTSQSDPGKI